jgi:hypothetical protein
MHRRTLLLSLSMLVTACADNKPPSYFKPPPPLALQDPLPGQALLYLLRAPHDQDSFSIKIQDKKPFVLGPSSYTVLSFPPGEYTMTGAVDSIFGGSKPAFVPAQFRLIEGQRLFLYVSGVNDSSFFLNSLVPFGRGGVLVDGGIRTSTVASTRSWKECSELDAQGFMSTSTLKTVE